MALDSRSCITVAGAGSVGCYVGGCLALAGRQVNLLLRPSLAESIASNGMRVTALDGADRRVSPSSLRLETDAAAALSPADVILITAKCGATAEIAELIARHARPGAVVVSLQNGVGNVHVLKTRLGADFPVVAGMVPFNIVRAAAAGEAPHFHRATAGSIRICAGRAGLRALLDVEGASVAEDADMTGVLWGKLVINMNNAINALSGLPLQAQLSDRRWRRLLARQMDEAFASLRAARIRTAAVEGVPPRVVPFALRLPDRLFKVVARGMLAIDPTARSSMSDDLARGRQTEIDYLQGVVLSLARETGTPAPLTENVVRLVKQIEAGGGSAALRPEEIDVAAHSATPAA